MPNHIHGIIQIQNTNVGATLAVALDAPDVPGAVVVPDVPVVVDAPDAPGATVAPRATARVAPTGGIAGVAAPGAIATSGATARVARTTVGRIVGAYKSLVFKKCLEISNLKNCILGKLWQRNYYEHIIRNEEEYAKIAEYIQNNPILWVKDCFKGKSGRRAKVGA
jgi:REP element-mobilizing transposase RayT